MREKTKRDILVIIVLIEALFLLLAYIPESEGVELGVQYNRTLPESENFAASDGIKISIAPSDSLWYLWGSADIGEMKLVSQPFGDLLLLGGGVGIKKEIVNGFSFFIELGYYYPNGSEADKWHEHNDGMYDKIYLHLNEKYSQIYGIKKFDIYKMTLREAIGGSIGVNLVLNKGSSMEVNLFAGYRLLTIRMKTEAHWLDPTINGYWNRVEYEELSGLFVGASIAF
jgi:hypothetical protein